MINPQHEYESSVPFDGTQARPREQEQAEVTHYAYDPQTYEILCRPGQRLNEKKAQRLRELNLYAHVITVHESHSP
jgi:hypothetical protein